MTTDARQQPRGEMPFLDHLEELRWRIIWSAGAVAVCTLVGFVLVNHFGVVQLLILPVQPLLDGQKLKYLSPADPFILVLKVSIVAGLILASPVVAWQVWLFLVPALEPHEKKVIVPSLWLGVVLFLSGVALAYFAALPLTLRFLMGFLSRSLEQQIVAGPYLGFVTRLLVSFGMIFELPVVVMILSAMGLITPEFLRDKRRHAIVIITVAASVISPGDVVSLTLMMMIPMIFLYELSIQLSKLIYRRKRKRGEEERQEPSREPPPGTVETR